MEGGTEPCPEELDRLGDVDVTDLGVVSTRTRIRVPSGPPLAT